MGADNGGISRLVVGGASGDGSGGIIDTSKTYRLTCQCSGKVLATGSLLDGADVVQWDYLGNSDQKWQFIDAGGGYYKIKNVYSGKMMEVYGWSITDGAAIDQWSDHGGANQQWALEDAGGGYYRIKNKNSGLYAAISEGSTSNGAQLIQWHNDGGSNFKFQLVEVY